ncbi:methyl-accepting chemotaxis protein [Noviherbaspirillum sp. ST9]|uniref:methyl-accepting chemotaxis protein n=1 Tax=Noviherbaspirillum sp. ST9 TaxID=3401606 RepID=UPI003B58AE23
MDLRNYRIGVRLGGCFAAILIALVGMIWVTYFTGEEETRTAWSQTRNLAAKASAIAELQASILLAKNAAAESATHADSIVKDRAALAMHHYLNRYAAARERILGSALSSDELRYLNDIEDVASELQTMLHIASASSSNGASVATEWRDGIFGQVTALSKAHEAAIEEQVNTARSSGRMAVLLMTSLIATALAWLLARRLSHSITAPLQSALSLAKRVAAGDLSSQPKVTGKDEVSDLVGAFATMNAQLLKIVTQVQASTKMIAQASDGVSTGSADLSERTESQASSLEETASAMEELTGTVRQNATSASSASRLAGSSAAIAEEGGRTVQNVVRTMEAIKDRSRRIADIVGVIDGIAFQTNILALNAAVEAARAGEHGRGFAVVASEVRALSQRSSAAAREIRDLIDGAVKQVESGNALAEDAGRTMHNIVASVQEVAALIGEIAQASGEQSDGIDAVSQAISSMDAMTQKNAVLVGQNKASAESLHEQVAALSGAVSVFRIESNVDEAVAMVGRAVREVKQSGREPALEAFSRQDPTFKYQDLYINAIDVRGNMLASGENRALVGKNLIDLKDADGKSFIKEFVRVATSVGKGWVDYRWKNPVSGVVESKSTYIERVGDLILACGIYK